MNNPTPPRCHCGATLFDCGLETEPLYCGSCEAHRPREKFPQTAEQACDAFQAELERVHGKDAGDMRYDPSGDTPKLAALRKAFKRAIARQREYHAYRDASMEGF